MEKVLSPFAHGSLIVGADIIRPMFRNNNAETLCRDASGRPFHYADTASLQNGSGIFTIIPGCTECAPTNVSCLLHRKARNAEGGVPHGIWFVFAAT